MASSDKRRDRPNEPDCEAVLADYLRRIDAGESVDRRQLMAAHPALAEELADYFSAADLLAVNAAEIAQLRRQPNRPAVRPGDTTVRADSGFEVNDSRIISVPATPRSEAGGRTRPGPVARWPRILWIVAAVAATAVACALAGAWML